MGRTRIAHVTTVDLSLRYLLLNQLRFLRERGFDVVGISAPGPHVEALEAEGIRHIPVKMTRAMNPLRDVVSLIDLQRIFRRERFDIVHTHNPKPGLYGQLAARATGVPHVVNTIHGFYFHDGMKPHARQLFIFLEKLAAAQSDAILSQNPEDVVTAEREGIAPPGLIEHLGNGIDLTRFHPGKARPRDEMRASLGIPTEVPVVGFVGRLVEEKGILELFDAMARVRRTHPLARLVVIGPTDAEKADALTPEGLRARYPSVDVVFTGLRNDMPDLLAALDVFVLPSWREGFPRSPMEAAAMERPVVVTDIRGCREVCVDGETGTIVPVRDAERLAAAVSALLAEPARARAYGQRARRLAEERFDERQVFAKVEETYRRLLAERRSRG